jgi:hypothetical protein
VYHRSEVAVKFVSHVAVGSFAGFEVVVAAISEAGEMTGSDDEVVLRVLVVERDRGWDQVAVVGGNRVLTTCGQVVCVDQMSGLRWAHNLCVSKYVGSS